MGEPRPARRIAVLGSTGSIGRSTLEVIAQQPDRFQVAGLASRNSVDALAEQVARFRPALAVVSDAERGRELPALPGGTTCRTGPDGLAWLATHPDVDTVVIATSGRDALVPLIRAIQAGKRIALASKELLVMAGELIMRLVQEHGTTLVPIDSEHAGLFQCLRGVAPRDVARLIVTGSGGSLWGKRAEAIAAATPEQVLAHPKWQMGRKITVDSATLMNKGLEVIEAHWLFGVPLDRIGVVIHPEAAVHALIELIDGTMLAQLAVCDMRLPIQYALSYPDRLPSTLPRLSLAALGSLRFVEPDTAQFPCLPLALQAASAGGTACAALNGANEEAVHAFLQGALPFGEIAHVIRDVLDRHEPIAHPTLEEILAADAWSRQTAGELIHQWSLR